jgi:hypothetical protein
MTDSDKKQTGSTPGCWKCPGDSWTPHVQPVTMCGVYVAVLCPSHRNQFERFIYANELYTEFRGIEEVVAVALMRAVRGEDVAEFIKTHHARSHELRIRLFDICEAWVSG